MVGGPVVVGGPVTAAPRLSGEPAFQLKVKSPTAPSLRVLTVSIRAMKQWAAYKDKTPLLFEVFGALRHCTNTITNRFARAQEQVRPTRRLPDQYFDRGEFFYVHIISTFVNVKMNRDRSFSLAIVVFAAG